jgi:hypothetical protein
MVPGSGRLGAIQGTAPLIHSPKCRCSINCQWYEGEWDGLPLNATVVSAHTAEQIISAVTVQTADRSAAVAVALAVVSEALRRLVVSPSR